MKRDFSKVKHSSVTNLQNSERMVADIILFKDTFVVDKLIKEDTSDKVAFIEALVYDVFFMQLFVNTKIYSMSLSDRFEMAVTGTLNLNGKVETGYHSQEEESPADSYEYVMCGRLYNISEYGSEQAVNLEIEISFAGLLMVLKGNPSYVSQLELDQTLFFLIKKL